MNFLTPQINPVSLYRLMTTPPPNGKVRNPARWWFSRPPLFPDPFILTKEPGTPPWPWRQAISGTDRRLPQDFLGACTFLEEANNEQVNKHVRKSTLDAAQDMLIKVSDGSGRTGRGRGVGTVWKGLPGALQREVRSFSSWGGHPPANPHSGALTRRGGGWGSGLPRAAPAEAPADPAGRYFRTACPPPPDPGRPRLASRFPVALGSGLVSALRMWRLQIARQLRPGAAGKHASRRHAGQEPPRGAPSAHRGRLAGAEPPAQCAPGLWRSPIAARLHDGQHQGSPVLHEVRGDGPPLCAELTPPLEGLGAWPDPRESFSLLTSSP